MLARGAPRGEGTLDLSFPIEIHRVWAASTSLASIRDVLAVFADRWDAIGAVLWRIAEGAGKGGHGRLFIQAQYFRETVEPPFYQLPIWSISGECISTNTPAKFERTEEGWDPAVSYQEELDRLGIAGFVSIPISLDAGSQTGADSALTFYSTGFGFSAEVYRQLREAALLFPAVYRSIQERSSLALISEVEEVLRREHFYPKNDAEAQQRSAMDKVVQSIARHFQFAEIMIYVHNGETDAPGDYCLLAKEWPWRIPPSEVYREGEGGTGWVIQHKSPLRMWDMLSYEQDRAHYEVLYPGFAWEDRFQIRAQVREVFKLKAEQVFPLSYACVPILGTGKAIGALRCCISRNGPYHVDEDVLRVLQAVAMRLSDSLRHWFREQRQNADHADKDTAVTIMSSLGLANRFAMERWQQPDARERVMSYLFRVCQRSIPQADVIRVWLEEPGGKTLREVAVPGDQTSERRVVRKDAMAGSRHSAFEYVLSARTVLNVEKAGKNILAVPGDPDLESFAVAPILASKSRGVLVLGTRESKGWPATVSSAAIFIGEQLALYLDFLDKMWESNALLRELETSVARQAQLFLDFQHQLRSPINIARNSFEKLEKLQVLSEPERERAQEVLGSSLRRASTVANNLQLFVRLAENKPVISDLVWLDPRQTLEDIDKASGFLYNKAALGREISFEVQKRYSLPLPVFSADPDLLALAIDNLLDNAVKYSYAGTRIHIKAVRASFGREIYFSLRNRGLQIDAADIQALTVRGHRGSDAKITSPEGTGIGLWMIDKVMKSMNGRLEILPTDGDGWNDFRLFFSSSETERESY